MTTPLNIVVGGYIVGLPLAGMTWHHLHYLLGLSRLGHRVTFLEDSGEYSVPYNPTTWTTEADPTYGIAFLQRCFAQVGLPSTWCYVSRFVEPGKLTHFGLTEEELHDTLRAADLYVSVSGVTPWHESRPWPRRSLGIDTDPVYTQAKMQVDGEFDAYWRGFDRLATFGVNVTGEGDGGVPTHGLHWEPTRQPVVLDQWPVEEPPGDAPWTTVGQWDHADHRHVDLSGRRLLSSKAPGWELLRSVKTRQPRHPAMSKVPGEVRTAYDKAGWSFTDPTAASLSLDAYARFLRASYGEMTPAKEIYAATNCGWFSDRSACFLASGRPVITQDTGFQSWLPTGEGLFAFRTAAEAEAAAAEVEQNPARHRRAARRLAEEAFDHERVLTRLLDFATA